MLWGITSYFNPVGYRRRRLNYRVFRERLQVPLIAVECSFGGGFELTPRDADVLIQIREGDVMWQKERLLNVALQALPPECTAVAWLDSDVVFRDDDWPGRAMTALQDAAIVHLFRERYHPPKDACSIELDTVCPGPAAISSVHLIHSGQHQPSLLEQAGLHSGWTNGLAWAGRRDVLERHGLYDACIVGSGDRALLCAAFGCFEALGRVLQLDRPRYDHYLSWARPFHDAVRNRVSAIDGAVFHLWHGELSDRHYSARHRDMASLNFNPYTDLSCTRSGSWQWCSDKPELHTHVLNYFRARNEDGEPLSHDGLAAD